MMRSMRSSARDAWLSPFELSKDAQKPWLLALGSEYGAEYAPTYPAVCADWLRPIIIPLVGVETLRLDVGRPVEGWRRSGLNLDRGEAFLCVRCRLSRDLDIEFGQFPV
jgi:hypothetical protein